MPIPRYLLQPITELEDNDHHRLWLGSGEERSLPLPVSHGGHTFWEVYMFNSSCLFWDCKWIRRYSPFKFFFSYKKGGLMSGLMCVVLGQLTSRNLPVTQGSSLRRYQVWHSLLLIHLAPNCKLTSGRVSDGNFWENSKSIGEFLHKYTLDSFHEIVYSHGWAPNTSICHAPLRSFPSFIVSRFSVDLAVMAATSLAYWFKFRLYTSIIGYDGIG